MLIFFLISCQTDGTLSQIKNDAPEITIFTHGETTEVLEGEPITYGARALDNNNEYEDLTITWFLDGNEVCSGLPINEEGEQFCDIEAEENSTEVLVDILDSYGASSNDFVTLTVVPNDPPVIDVHSPIQEQRYYLSHPVEFSATIVDLQDPIENLLFEWSSSIDDIVYSTSPNNNGFMTESFMLSEGDHVITLKVTDSAGDVTVETRNINVSGTNSIPICEIIEPTESTVYAQLTDELTFTASATDSDVLNDMLDVSWTSSIDGSIGQVVLDSNGLATVVTNALSEGEHIITFRVEDEAGESCTKSVAVDINGPPITTITAPAPNDAVPFGEPILFEGTVTDATNPLSEVTVSWESNVDGVFHTQGVESNGNITFYTEDLSTGEHVVTATATDGDGNFSTTTLPFLVNTKPTLIIPQSTTNNNDGGILPDAHTATELVAIIETEDADGHHVTVNYEWYQNGNLTNHTGDRIPATEVVIGHTWELRATPNDGYMDGVTVIDNATVENGPPVIANHSILPNAPYYDSFVICTANVSDPEEIVTASYQWLVDGQTYNGNQLDLSSLNLEPLEPITCIVTSADSFGLESTSDLTVSITNRLPSFSSHLIEPTVVYANSSPTCVSTYEDLDNETPVATYSWDLNGTNVSTNPILESHINLEAGDQLDCTITLTDGYGGITTNTVSETVLNANPIIHDITFDPYPANRYDSLDCIVDASDNDGDPIIMDFVFEHIQTGTIYQPTNVTSTSAELDLTAINLNIMDQINCTVTVSDPYGGVVTDNAIVNVSDSSPIITIGASIDPQDVFTGDILTCSLRAEDFEDGILPVNYSWFINNATTALATGSQFTVTAADTDVSDVIKCVAEATDLSGNTVTDETTVQIQNTPPQISNTIFTPYSNLYVDSVVQCATQITDPDETIAPLFSWQLNGVGVGSNSTLDLQTVGANPLENLRCSVSGTDGSGASVSDQISAPIVNRAPSSPGIAILPSNPVAQEDDITCTIMVPSNDADNQLVTYSYSWTKNGIGVLITDPIIPANMLNEGDHWRCVVTPNDGYDDGAFVATTSFILSPCFYGECDEAFQLGTVGIDLTIIDSGLFEMGSPTNEVGRLNREDKHFVYLNNDFYAMTTEVTQQMFQTIMGYNPSYFGPEPVDTATGGLYNCGTNCPVEYVTWHEAAQFANILTAYVNATQSQTYESCYTCTGFGSTSICSIDSDIYSCTGFRLPTEAEWEYMARADSTMAIWTPGGGANIPNDVDPDGTAYKDTCDHPLLLSDTSNYLEELGHYCFENTGVNGDQGYGTKPVALKTPNDFGLYDIIGNVREWTNDQYNYSLGYNLVIDPIELSMGGNTRVTRGGYWNDTPQELRSAARTSNVDTIGLNGIGFRLVQTIP